MKRFILFIGFILCFITALHGQSQCGEGINITSFFGYPLSVGNATIGDNTWYFNQLTPASCAETGHSFGDWIITPATCTAEGNQERTCSVCHEKETENIPKLPHTFVWIETTAPTCIEDGLETEICSECDHKSGETQKGKDAFGHDWDDWVITVIPTKTSDGSQTKTCRNDPSHTETEIIDKIPSWTVFVINGTGGGDYAEGETVTISAETPPIGKQFKNWTATPEVSFTDANSESTTFTMPTSVVTVTAQWNDIVNVISVTVSPSTISVEKGTTLQFTANVTTQGGASDAVIWLLSGNALTATNINQNGFLTVAAAETAITLFITVTSVLDPTKFDAATVTVTGIHSVTFNTQDGEPSARYSNIQAGSTVTPPSNPTRPGYIFEGWYRERDCINKWDFATDVLTADLVLYAKWTPITKTEEFWNMKHKIYPNPTDGIVTIEFETYAVYTITITDMSGRIQTHETITTQSMQMDISNFSTGVYLLTINDGKQQSTIRIVKE